MMFDFDLVFQTDYVRSDLLFFFMEDRIFYMFVSFLLDNLCRGMLKLKLCFQKLGEISQSNE